jgi:hypothetical protein
MDLIRRSKKGQGNVLTRKCVYIISCYYDKGSGLSREHCELSQSERDRFPQTSDCGSSYVIIIDNHHFFETHLELHRVRW